jgi:HAD superfamily hydrolase (TIGR01509 family)
MIKGVIFDFNGTMFFDSDIQESAWRIFLRNKTGKEITDIEFQEYVHGRNAEVSLSYFLGKTLNKCQIESLAEEKEVVYRELCLSDKSRFKLTNGLPKFLEVLKQDNIPCTIATASGFNNVKFFFEHLNLDKWFDFTDIVYDDGTFLGKPEPDIFIKASQKINIPPADCIVFEDAKSGITAAKRAGIGRIIGISLSQNQFQKIEGLHCIVEDFSNAHTFIK